MYRLKTTKRFDKDLKRCQKRGLSMQRLREVLTLLVTDGALPKSYKPHKLTGNYTGKWECHIQPDWLLVWEQNDTELVLLLIGTGTHVDLF